MLNPDTLFDYWPALVGTVRNLLPRADYTVWEDLAADTVERALRNAHRYDDRGNGPGAWLTTMASRVVIDHLRRANNRTSTQPLEAWTAATVDAGSARHVAHMDLHDAVGALPDTLTAFVSLRLLGVDARAAGHQIGLLEKAAWLREQSARALLRPRLGVSV